VMLKHTVSIEWACAQLEISGSSNKKKKKNREQILETISNIWFIIPYQT